ncbi:MAG: NUDIX domain-containing protein [Planctomycetota bacterium]
MTKTDLVRAAGVVVMTATEPRSFLLMRHSDRWDLPKGHCDGDESYHDAARRELSEETGLAIPIDHYDPKFAWDIQYDVTYGKRAVRMGGQPGTTWRKNVRYFLAFVRERSNIALTEHQSSQWLPWAPLHRIQSQTIDPLLSAIEIHMQKNSSAVYDICRRVMDGS